MAWKKLYLSVLSLVLLTVSSVNCSGTTPQPEYPSSSQKVTLEDLTRALENGPKESCFVGTIKGGIEIFVSKNVGDQAVKFGKFRVTVINEKGEGSTEFYDDLSRTVKALTDRGGSDFRPCRKPREL
jgi:hypothetical protein